MYKIQDILKSPYPFEKYLEMVHGFTYTGLDDDMQDAFNHWLTELEGAELIGYGNSLAKLLISSMPK